MTTTTICKFDVKLYGNTTSYAVEANLASVEDRDLFVEAMKDALTTIDGQDASLYLSETSLRGIARYIGRKARASMLKVGATPVALRFYPEPDSYVYSESGDALN